MQTLLKLGENKYLKISKILRYFLILSSQWQRTLIFWKNSRNWAKFLNFSEIQFSEIYRFWESLVGSTTTYSDFKFVKNLRNWAILRQQGCAIFIKFCEILDSVKFIDFEQQSLKAYFSVNRRQLFQKFFGNLRHWPNF